MSVAVGFTLQPEQRYLELLDGVLREEPDYYVVAPETTWRPEQDGVGEHLPNGYHARFLELGAETGKGFVGHGVGFSLGTAVRDEVRDGRWLRRLALDQEFFDFRWYTDHLGATVLDGRELTLPLPLPYTDEARGAVAEALRRLGTVFGDVGFENSVFYFHLGDPLDEPAWIARCLEGAGRHLLLDLHNVYTTAVNAGFDPRDYVARLPLEKVIELHLSGGDHSDPRWLPSGNVLRLDSHDHGVPDEVWALFEETLPRLPNLRGVTLERMEGTVDEDDVPVLREELRRVRRTLELARV